MTKDELVKAIENIEGVLRVYAPSDPINTINGETSIQINVYYPASPPDLGVSVSDGMGLKDEVK